LRSRFDLTVDFPDYSDAELVDIVISMSRSQSLEITDEARSLLAAYIAEIGRGRHFGNGREARKWLDAIVQEQAQIWSESGGNELAALRVISAAAVEAGLKRFPRRKQDRPIGFIGGL
jgi:Holliday junction resolvasome RuvABC ATP-dependent DNA helicase subunit